MRKPTTAAQALERLQELCSRAEMCQHEADKKMYNWGILPDDRRRVIDRLVDDRYIDDTRYARAFVHDKLTFAGWGRVKIRMALRAKRISTAAIAAALDAIAADDYLEAARRVIMPRLRRLLSDNDCAAVRDLPFEVRQKFYRSMVMKGFEPEVIKEALKGKD